MTTFSAQVFRKFSTIVALLAAAALAGGCAHLQPRPFTFAQMCDPQIGFGGYEADLKRLEAAVERLNELRPDFVVVCGDLVNTPNPKSFKDFNRVMTQLNQPFFCAPGNHDVGNEPTLESLQTYRKFIGRDYYSFTRKGCAFVVLNTQLWKSPMPGETERQEDWLQATLQAAAQKARPVFVIEHYPPFVKTADEPDAYFNLPQKKRQELLSSFERYGVVAVLAGHTHTTSTNQFGRIQVVTSESTSKNFDNRPFGFRLWHIHPDGTCRHEFVPLEKR